MTTRIRMLEQRQTRKQSGGGESGQTKVINFFNYLVKCYEDFILKV